MRAVFIHLSDIHFGQEKDGGRLTINTDAKRSLIEDAKAEFRKLGSNASGIILTGDIAYSAQVEEYIEAGRWLDSLSSAIGCDRLNVQMVPGNHDIDRDAITPATKWRLDSIRDQGDSTLDLLLDDENEREALYERFKAYRDFSAGYGCALDVGGAYSADGVVKLAEGRTLRFVRLNSALICSRKDDEGKLILGARQRVIPSVDGEETVILMHHPLNWLQDSQDARRYIRSRARILISGHEHFPSLAIEDVEPDCQLMLLAAGATAPDHIDDRYTYKYNILSFEWDADSDGLAVTINPRTWDDERKRFDRDTQFLEGKSERNVLACPNFRKGARPQGMSKTASANDGLFLETVANPIVGTDEAIVSINPDEKIVRLQFFRDLTEGQRFQVLVQFGAIPEFLRETLDHALEQVLLTRLLKAGRTRELLAAIEDKLDKKTGGNP